MALAQRDWDFPGVAEAIAWNPPTGTLTDDTGNVAEDALSSMMGDARDLLHEHAGSSADDPEWF
jgi:hypothetical protein